MENYGKNSFWAYQSTGGFILPEFLNLNSQLTGISHQGSRQQAGLAQDLKAVANAEDKFTVSGKLLYRLHDRRKSRQCSGPQVIAVRKSARHDHGVKSAQVGFLVPDKINRLAD